MVFQMLKGLTTRSQRLKEAAAIGSRGIASVTDQFATAAVSFVVSIFIGRQLGADALGFYAISNVFVMLLRAFQSSLILEPMSVFGPRQSMNKYGGYFTFLTIFSTAWIFLLSIILAVSALVCMRMNVIEYELFYILVFSCIYINIVCTQYFIRRQFYIDDRQYLATIQSLSFLLLLLIGLFLLWYWGFVDVVTIYASMSMCSLLICIAQWGRFWKRLAWPTRNDIRLYASDHWSYGKWVLLGVPFGMITYHGFFAIVGLALSPEAAGLLKAADTFIAPFAQLVIGTQMMLLPITSRKADTMSVEAQKRLSRRILAIFLCISIVYSTFLYFFGEWAIIFLFGDKLREAVPLLAILSFLPLVRGLPEAAAVVLSARKQAKLRFFSQLYTAMLTLFSCIPLIHYGGLFGAAIGMILSQVIYASCLWTSLLWLWRRDRRLARNIHQPDVQVGGR